MSTSQKTPASIRQGGPGSSQQDATAPLDVRKPPAEPDDRHQSRVSGGGGEKDSHHTHDSKRK
jgi:hypothetical protein